MESKGQCVSVNDIEPGYVCVAELRDDLDRVLIAPGIPLTQEFLSRLKELGIQQVYVGALDSVGITHKKSPHNLDARRGKLGCFERRIDRSREPLSPHRTAQFAATIGETLSLLENIGTSIRQLSPAATAQLCSLPESIAEMLVEDSDQALLAVIPSEQSRQLSARCAQMSVLASSTAMEMKFSDEEVAMVGIAALVHDLGLYLLPTELQASTHTLTTDERELYRSHPRLTVDLLSECSAITEQVKLLILQVHELADGSGFPRGLKRHRFHPLTSILNAVEIYLTLVAPGAGRPAFVSHDALRIMLYQCSQGMLDPDVLRAFINQFSLFPIGSRVLLDDASKAMVVRRDGDYYDMPVVQLQESQNGELVPIRDSARRIASPLHNPATEMRIEKAVIQSLTLDALIVA
jgi:HD-GYP domain-containing protein (c-di-GMP phosphodiesterase class II)